MKRSSFFALVSISSVAAAQPAYRQGLIPQGPNANVAQLFGSSMAENNGVLVVGAPHGLSGTAATLPGQVAYYLRAGTLYTLATTLRAPTPTTGDGFGNAVALSPTTLVVGAAYDDTGSANRGRAFAYDLSAPGRGPDAPSGTTISIDPGVALPANSGFGFAVATDNDWIVIGAPFAGAGEAQVYWRNPQKGQWQYHSRLTGPTATGSSFGIRTLLRGDQLFVAAHEEGGGANRGFVYAFRRNGSGGSSTWALTQRFRSAADGSPGVFGSSLALNERGDTLVVGAPFSLVAGNTNTVGSTFVFRRSGDTWSQVARINPPTLSLGVRFGSAVAIRGDEILIGDNRELRSLGNSAINEYGGAHIYAWNGSAATLRQSIRLDSVPQQEDFFGTAVLLTPGLALIGAPGSTFVNTRGTPTGPGAVYTYDEVNGLLRDGFDR